MYKQAHTPTPPGRVGHTPHDLIGIHSLKVIMEVDTEQVVFTLP